MLKSCGLEVVALWSRTEAEAQEMSNDLGIANFTTDVDKVIIKYINFNENKIHR